MPALQSGIPPWNGTNNLWGREDDVTQVRGGRHAREFDLQQLIKCSRVFEPHLQLSVCAHQFEGVRKDRISLVLRAGAKCGKNFFGLFSAHRRTPFPIASCDGELS